MNGKAMTPSEHRAARKASTRQQFAARAALAAHRPNRDSVVKMAAMLEIHTLRRKPDHIVPRRGRASVVRHVQLEG